VSAGAEQSGFDYGIHHSNTGVVGVAAFLFLIIGHSVYYPHTPTDYDNAPA
jgi:hypothetical protein